MSRLFQRLIFVLGAAVFAALGLGFALGELGWFGVHAGGEQDGAYNQIHVYQQVLRRIQSDYVTDPNMTTVTTGALHGLLESLDSDSSYLTATEYKIWKERPTTGVAQVGITVSKRYGYATVVNVLPGSPADHEHVADGDVIEAIGDTSTRELSLAVIRLMLEGKPGTNVTITLVKPRKPDPDKLTLTRAIVPEPAMGEQQYLDSSVLYLKPVVINNDRMDQLAAKIKANKGKKIVLDLRDTGGDEEAGLRLANFFVEKGTLASLEGQKYPKVTFAADASKFLTNAPLVVLVNRGSYGPAELAASAIESAKRGDVVGERTFGEGSVQKTIDLPDGAALLLTVAKYQGPDGKKIQDEAVNPNVQAGTNPDGDIQDETPDKDDKSLDKALSILKSKNS
ncbi:S41 family peptidase [Occallatibacter riparius]|uniref:S41 family peptidase n=1 Tax=Occallatibacter riparius TaxID=1002689 RepID=A0A9J7BUB2_9BACT|nr:S41 family peptidase [Occallatibacter riparius]UWZ86169.1 S41 family peptidase [Occallatibacter riparius]